MDRASVVVWMASSYELADAARDRVDFLRTQRALLDDEAARYQLERDRLHELYLRNRKELGSYLLAEVSDGEIRALEARLSYPGLIPIKRRFELRLEDARRQLTELLGEPEGEHNAFYMSQLQDEMEEVREVHDRLLAQVNAWRQHEEFQELERRGFFLESYDSGVFGWLRDWRAVSLLMEALEEAQGDEVSYPTPAAVRQAWNKLWGEAEPILEMWAGLVERERRLAAIGEKRKLLEDAPRRLFQELYEALTEAVCAHVDALPDEAKLALVKDDKHLASFLQKDMGLQKQVQYLDELRLRRVMPLIQQLDSDVSRLNTKITKLRRKHKSVSDADVTKMRTFKAESWLKRRQRIEQTRERVGGFSKYDRGSFTRDYLWWDTMTGGAPADDIYEVRVFRMSNPGFDHRHYHTPWDSGASSAYAMDHAADALADSLGSGSDDLLLGDVS